MKKLYQIALGVLLFGATELHTQAAFSSLYIFGDGLSTTTDNTSGLPYYYGKRYSNGRVWVEVLAQRQGLVYNAANNNSYFDHNSALTLADVKNFQAPPDVSKDLFIVWVCNSDTYDAASSATPLTFAQWQGTNALSQANYLQIITTLYGKGVRALVLPNVVDISRIPAFDASSLAPTMRAGCIDYDAKFSNTIAQAQALCPELKIYAPNFFALLDNVLSNAPSYGLTNALSGGWSVGAAETISGLTMTNNPGTNYIYWDATDPSAKFHEVIADVAQQVISPVQIGGITALNGFNQLNLLNVPIGLNGYVDGCTNLEQQNWASLTNVTSTSASLSLFVQTPPSVTATNVQSQGARDMDGGVNLPPGGTFYVTALEFYRLRFPYAWNWP